MKEERSGPYLFPPLQLTKDSLEALVHVVKLGGKKKERSVIQPPNDSVQHNLRAKSQWRELFFFLVKVFDHI